MDLGLKENDHKGRTNAKLKSGILNFDMLPVVTSSQWRIQGKESVNKH